MRWLLRFPIIPLVSLSSVDAQPATPAQSVPLPQAIYSPQPVYRPEWAKQGLTGKGVVLVTIDPKTGMVTGTRMLQSTREQTTRRRCSGDIFKMALQAWQRAAGQDAD